jgi:hypothetical protein
MTTQVNYDSATPGYAPSGFNPSVSPPLVDPPLAQDADYEYDASDRGYLDSQILTIQYWLCQIWAIVAALTGGGSTYVAPMRLTFNGANPSGTQLVCSGQDQEFFVNQSAGQGTYPAPVLSAGGPLQDGQRFTITDTAGGGSWATHPPIITVTGGTAICSPSSLGTVSTTSVTMPAINYDTVTFVYGKSENTWFLND